jgi:hypothetical protein
VVQYCFGFAQKAGFGVQHTRVVKSNMFFNCGDHYRKGKHSKEQTKAGVALLALSLASSSCLHLLLHSEVIGPRFPLPGGLTGPHKSLPSGMGKLLTGAAKVMLGCVSPLLQDILLSLG